MECVSAEGYTKSTLDKHADIHADHTETFSDRIVDALASRIEDGDMDLDTLQTIGAAVDQMRILIHFLKDTAYLIRSIDPIIERGIYAVLDCEGTPHNVPAAALLSPRSHPGK